MSAATAPKKATKVLKPKVVASHPPVAQMVNSAIRSLKDRKGSSLIAIKKYIGANYKADAAKLAPFIRRYLKKAVTDGKLSQAKGTGASGSFKLPSVEKKPAMKKVKKPKSPKKSAKKPAKKSPAKPKKAKTPKKKSAAKKPAKK